MFEAQGFCAESTPLGFRRRANKKDKEKLLLFTLNLTKSYLHKNLVLNPKKEP